MLKFIDFDEFTLSYNSKGTICLNSINLKDNKDASIPPLMSLKLSVSYIEWDKLHDINDIEHSVFSEHKHLYPYCQLLMLYWVKLHTIFVVSVKVAN